MDIEKLIKFMVHYLSDYWWFFSETLRKPTLKFKLLSPPDDIVPNIDAPVRLTDLHRFRLNPKLISFAVLSVFIGSTINELIPNRNTAGFDIVTTFLITMALWFFYSFLFFIVCKIFNGKGSFEETLGIGLQLLSVIYVIASLFAYLGGLIVSTFQSQSLVGFFTATTTLPTSTATFRPIVLFFYAEFFLWILYMPMALKVIHHFGRVRQIVVGFIAATVFLILNLSFYSSGFVMGIAPSRFESLLYNMSGGLIIAWYFKYGVLIVSIFLGWVISYLLSIMVDKKNSMVIEPSKSSLRHPKYWVVIVLQVFFGGGLFYANPKLKRKWLYLMTIPLLLLIYLGGLRSLGTLWLIMFIIYFVGLFDSLRECRVQQY